jgi:hypothetical protein
MIYLPITVDGETRGLVGSVKYLLPLLLSETFWLYVTRPAQYEVSVIVTIILVQAWTAL